MSDDARNVTAGAPEALLERMLSRGWEFDFFQAVWLLERYYSDGVSVGGRGPVAKEAVRFRPHVSVGFPSTDVRRITKLESAKDSPTFRIDVTFLGLYGVSTPLPVHYAIQILRSVDPYVAFPEKKAETPAHGRTLERAGMEESPPVRDFLDIFHHRLISLFYRCWTKYRYDVAFGLPGRDDITHYLLWFIGCHPDYTRGHLGVEPLRLIRYAGLLTQQPKTFAALEGLVSDYWEGLPVAVEQFVGRWVAVDPDDRNRLGAANSRVGQDLILGEEVYDLSGLFRITLGAVDWSTFTSFLPDGENFFQTWSLVRFFSADPLSFTIEVKLKAGQVPPMELSSGDAAPRLGYTSWLRTAEVAETSVDFDTQALVERGIAGAR